MSDINIHQLIIDLRKKRDAILERMQANELDLAEIEKQLSAAEQTEELYYRQYNIPVPNRAPDARLQQKFAGLSIREMLILIASEAEDTLDVSDAKRLLIKAGVFKDERNAATSTSPIISRHADIFKRTAKGNYHLDRSFLNQKESKLLEQVNKPKDYSGDWRQQALIERRTQASPFVEDCRPWLSEDEA